MSGQGLFWILLVAAVWAAVALTVQRERIWKLLGPAFVGGFLLTFVVQFGGVALGLWQYRTAAIPISGVPLSVMLGWWGAIVLFLAYLPQQNLNRYILLFAAAGAAVNYLAVLAGAQQFLRWNVFLSFVLGILLHWIVAYGYLFWNRRLVKA